ncbi:MULTISPECIES: hypothetical protein [Pseudomonas]|uniref:hypothetical protein n=1 Tax=Pseudomonas TaxID=286 RepID=UPI00098F7210|nr:MULTISPECIES: hypothetical protein [Pseudomonas]AQT94568.1 hypothetical protein B1R45_15250 [Pseudomonas azotoformans]MBT1260252.1 hypothetical protein [Pseudomonas sp. VS40]MBT1271906.1 hypothetical protein [Pseudomonas sp. VS59]UMY46677.1 hypothetical protein MLC69_15205 [Pseudomonas azotoformans]
MMRQHPIRPPSLTEWSNFRWHLELDEEATRLDVSGPLAVDNTMAWGVVIAEPVINIVLARTM